MTEQKLLSCPFCGVEAQIHITTSILEIFIVANVVSIGRKGGVK